MTQNRLGPKARHNPLKPRHTGLQRLRMTSFKH
jgi:hypothetical protein